MAFHQTPNMALFSSSLPLSSPHSLMLVSSSSTPIWTSISIVKLFSPITQFLKNPQTFISSSPSLKTREPIRSSASSGPSSYSAHEIEGEGESSPPSSSIIIKSTLFFPSIGNFSQRRSFKHLECNLSVLVAYCTAREVILFLCWFLHKLELGLTIDYYMLIICGELVINYWKLGVYLAKLFLKKKRKNSEPKGPRASI